VDEENVLIDEKQFEHLYYKHFMKSLFLMFLLGTSTVGIGTFGKQVSPDSSLDWIFMGFWVMILISVYAYYQAKAESKHRDLKIQHFHLKMIKS
jgi:hypothetical protein